MDFAFDIEEWTLYQVDSGFDSFDEMAQVSTSPSLSSLLTSDSYLDTSLPSDFLTNFCLEYYTTLTSDPDPTFVPAPTTTPTPSHIPHSRGRRAQQGRKPQAQACLLFPGVLRQFYTPRAPA